jgi:ParB/RepB/Spo0J family partition protein
MGAARHLEPVADAVTGPVPFDAELPIDSIVPDPHNIRGDVGDIGGLVASIKAIGIQQPVGVAALERKARGRQRYALIWGHRRYAAAKKAGLTVVPAMVRHGLDDVARLEAQITENLQRQDLSIMEEARAFARLAEHGRSQRAICQLVDRSQAHVSKRLSLLALDPPDQQALDAGKITIAEALELTRLADHPDAYRRARKACGDERLFRTVIRDALDELRWAPARELALENLPAGTTIVEWPRDWWAAKFKATIDNQRVLDERGDARFGPANTAVLRSHMLADWSIHSCDRHAAVTIAPSGDVILVCTDPKSHDKASTKVRKSRAEANAERQRVAKRAADRQRDRRTSELLDPDSGPGQAFAATIAELVAAAPPNSPTRMLLEVFVADSYGRNLRPVAKRLGITPVDLPYGQKDFTAGADNWVALGATDEDRFTRRVTVAIARAMVEIADALRNGWTPPAGTVALYRLLAYHSSVPLGADDFAGIPEQAAVTIDQYLTLDRISGRHAGTER